MADAVYHVKEDANYSSSMELLKRGFKYLGFWEDTNVLYRSAAWSKWGWVGLAIRGTMPLDPSGANLVQDYKMKKSSEAPWDLVKRAVTEVNRLIGPPRGQGIITGHSLGGSATQVLGLFYAIPFVTFNAPGMRYDLMRRAGIRQGVNVADRLAGPLATILGMTPPGRKLTERSVKATAGIGDQTVDQARTEIGQHIGATNPAVTSELGPDQMLGFNIAHSKDLIHITTSPPVGAGYRFADWTPTQAELKSIHNWGDVSATTIYHDMPKMADFLIHHNWGNERPVYAARRRDGTVFYVRKNYPFRPGWDNTAV